MLEKNWDGVDGAYGVGDTEVLFETINQYKKEFDGKNALVIGSETPWVEAILLAVGAKHVTTLEYNRIMSTHPQVYKTWLCLGIVSHFLIFRGISHSKYNVVSLLSLGPSGSTERAQ